jgi:class 3 adenylate cyclase/predicted ATPase/DNA-binding winged helix-turn-helix (wHTH) protein
VDSRAGGPGAPPPQSLAAGGAVMLYSIGDYTLDAEHYELRRAGRLVRLDPQAFNLLAYLVQHAGRTVTKEELEEQLWPDQQVVGITSLAKAVAQARKALGDTSRAQCYIQTVHRRGYRFVAPVTTQPPEAADLPAAQTPDPPQALPFPDQAHAVAPPTPHPTALPSPRPQTPLSYTPGYLAEKILTSRSALEGERKQVTVLRVSIHGTAEVLAGRDPEEAQALLDPCLERMLEAVHRYEGTVNHISGDGLMALFGAPLAHEDHAARACYAALAIQKGILRYAEVLRRANGVEIQLRACLNSGEVVVRAIGNDLHMEYAAVGHTTYLAAQLEPLVPPGAVWLVGETLRLVEGLVRVKPLDPVRVAGLATPVEVYELIGAEPTRTRLRAATARVLTPFVGRQHEFETLRQAQERAGAGHGQVVAVIGEPGVGKSRLFYEFTQAPHAKGWLLLEAGAVSSYGQASPYLPVIDLLRVYFRVDGPDDGRGMHEQVTEKLLALDEALRPTLPAFSTLLDLPVEDPQWQALDPAQRRLRILDAVKRVLLRESLVQPVLVIVENLHWIDAETQAVLDSVVESLPTAKILLLVNYRPDYQHGWGSKTYYSQVRLDPLPPARAEELLQALLGRDASLQPLKQRLIERTEGTPFFLEESVWTLAETKALVGERGAYRLARALPTVQVPATVHALLAARIDRLAAEDKRLLQAAAVIGRDVPFPLLQAIVEVPEEVLRRSLTRLQAAEFLYELQLFPEHVYTFKHALTQEVAYHSLLQRARQHYHQHIAQVLAQRFPDALATRPELLAHHYTEAGLSAAAIPYWQQAGRRAIERSAHLEAIGHLTKGLELLNALPQTIERDQQELVLQTTLGPALMAARGPAAPEVGRLYTRARELCQQVGETRHLFSVLFGLFEFYMLRAELQTAHELGEQLLRVARQERDTAHLLLAHGALGMTVSRGDLRAARSHLEQGIALYDPRQHHALVSLYPADPGVHCLSYAARVSVVLGYIDEALRRSREALHLAQELAHPFSLAYSLNHAGWVHQHLGDAQETRALAERLIALATEHGFPHRVAQGTILRGWALAKQGREDEGLSQIRQGLAAYRTMEAKQWRTRALILLAETYWHTGRAEEGLQIVDEALTEMHHDGGGDYLEAELYQLKGELLLTRSSAHRAEAEACFRQAIDIAHRQSARLLELRAIMSLSRLRYTQGKTQEARQQLAEIYGWFTEGFDTADLQEAKALLDEWS